VGLLRTDVVTLRESIVLKQSLQRRFVCTLGFHRRLDLQHKDERREREFGSESVDGGSHWDEEEKGRTRQGTGGGKTTLGTGAWWRGLA
jgi:hypothetical protein